MIVRSTPNDFYMHPNALTITLNAMGDANTLSASVYSNAKVTVFKKGVVDYNPDNNYRQWTLTAYPTHFSDTVARYCHLAVSRSGDAAVVVYPDTLLDFYGRAIDDEGKNFILDDDTLLPDGSENEPSVDGDYYFIFLGKLSASTDGQYREWLTVFSTGNLDTDQYRDEERKGEWAKMFEYDAAREAISQLLPIKRSQIWDLLLGTGRKLISDLWRKADAKVDDATPQDKIDEIVPSAGYVQEHGKKNYLSRTSEDSAAGRIEFKKGLQSDMDSEFRKGLSVAEDLSVARNASVGGNARIDGSTGSKTFIPGPRGTGWDITKSGAAQMDSLSLRKFLEVPEFRFNRVSVHTGVDWQTSGAGLIEDVSHPEGWPEDEGLVKLKLEDGEAGAIDLDDLCQGIWHNEGGGNAEENEDGHNGNFKFKGFQTVYFKIIDICDKDGGTLVTADENGVQSITGNNQYFRYKLRPREVEVDEETGEEAVVGWSDQHHPQPSMSFACYSNPTHPDRQACVYATTSYLIMLTGMVDWTYDASNIAYIRGYLEGFRINTRGGVIELHGHSIAFGSAYMWGNIEQFDRDPYLVTQQLFYYRTNEAPETVLDGKDWSSWNELDWTATPLSPIREEKYVYGYWLKTFDKGEPEKTTPSVVAMFGEEGQPGIAVQVLTDPSVIFIATSDWYDDGDVEADAETDDETESEENLVSVTFHAWLIVNSEQVSVASYDLTATIEGLTYSADTEDDGKVRFVVTFNPDIINQQVGNIAENNYITVTLTDADGNSAVNNVVVTENRQGDDGQDGEDGANAEPTVTYRLVPDMTSIVFDPKKGGGYIPDSVAVSCNWTETVGDVTTTHIITNEEDTTDIGGRYTIFFRYRDEQGNLVNDGRWRQIFNLADTDYKVVVPGGLYGSLEFCLAASVSSVEVTNDESLIIDRVSIPIFTKPKDGLQGCVVRMNGEWQPNVEYVNESESERDGVRYIDVVQYKVDGELKYFERKPKTDGYVFDDNYQSYPAPFDGSDYWQIANFMKFIATDLLIAPAAWIEYLTGKSHYLTDGNERITAGVQGEADNDEHPHFFAGSDYESVDEIKNIPPKDAPFRVMRDGSLYASKATVEGDITARSVNTAMYYLPDSGDVFPCDPATGDIIGEYGSTNIIDIAKLRNNEYTQIVWDEWHMEFDFKQIMLNGKYWQFATSSFYHFIIPESGVAAGTHVLIYHQPKVSMESSEYRYQVCRVSVGKAWNPGQPGYTIDRFDVKYALWGLYDEMPDKSVTYDPSKDYKRETRKPAYMVTFGGGLIELVACPLPDGSICWSVVTFSAATYELTTF